MERKMKVTAFIIILLCPACLRAEYTATEILVIPWGDGPNELEIGEPYLENYDDPGADTIGHLVSFAGPGYPFVDKDENFYFISHELYYFKGFDINGEVIVDYSQGKTEFRDEFFRHLFRGFYVDSLGRIFCNGNNMKGGYVAVADRDNNLLDKLNPFGWESGIPCSIVGRGADDVLTFQSWEHGNYTYMNGEFYPGGSPWWRAKNGVYYFGMPADASTIKLFRYENPDTLGMPTSIDSLYIPMEIENLQAGGVVGVDDDMNLYIDYMDSTGSHHGIRVYDQNLELLDELEYLPREGNRYLWDTLNPFFRSDGTIYEFHCLDDGMHIFRWQSE